jgi:hypothetical protein
MLAARALHGNKHVRHSNKPSKAVAPLELKLCASHSRATKLAH